jgi:hypothetical protein
MTPFELQRFISNYNPGMNYIHPLMVQVSHQVVCHSVLVFLIYFSVVMKQYNLLG